MRKFIFLIFSILLFQQSSAQLLRATEGFTRADTLRGMLTPLRNCYDMNYYHLNIKLDIENRKITGSNLFRFTATQDFDQLQFDLFENLQIEKIVYKGKPVKYNRQFNSVFVEFPEVIKQFAKDEFIVYYSGYPVVAQNAPWDGGFIFSKDGSGKPWVAVACQGLGASSWWPCKDHQADEVDSMLISVTIPPGLINVSNGRLRSVVNQKDGYNQHNWFVSYPINNYNVTLNIADYAHFGDSMNGAGGNLTLDYYVLKENLQTAKKHFPPDVKNMINSFEYWFGAYPFYRDGYKLVETPYLGMEHQSAIAYGNKFKKGYNGSDLSGTKLGLTWDYIIIHESGHEWFGNNITSKDIADMWIHESFTTYSEGLFVESTQGKAAGAKYLKGLRQNIRNTEPIIAAYNVNKEGSADMYPKGANLLHSIRTIINDDEKWRRILSELNKTFGLKTTTTEEIVRFINSESGIDFTTVFNQYLRYPEIPTLEIKKLKQAVEYRWKANVNDFNMPLRVKLNQSSDWVYIKPTTDWQVLEVEKKNSQFIIDTDNFYLKIKSF